MNNSEQTRGELAKAVSAQTGVPEHVVSMLDAESYDGLMEQAGQIARAYGPKGAPNAPEAGTFPREQRVPRTAADAFADWMRDKGMER